MSGACTLSNGRFGPCGLPPVVPLCSSVTVEGGALLLLPVEVILGQQLKDRLGGDGLRAFGTGRYLQERPGPLLQYLRATASGGALGRQHIHRRHDVQLLPGSGALSAPGAFWDSRGARHAPGRCSPQAHTSFQFYRIASSSLKAGGRVTLSGGTALTVAGAVLPGPGPWTYARVEDTGAWHSGRSTRSDLRAIRTIGEGGSEAGRGAGPGDQQAVRSPDGRGHHGCKRTWRRFSLHVVVAPAPAEPVPR